VGRLIDGEIESIDGEAILAYYKFNGKRKLSGREKDRRKDILP